MGGDDKLSENINVCYQIGHFFNVSDSVIQEGLQGYQSASHRMTKSVVRGVTILDDSYNANPSGVEYALQYLRRFKGRKILVLGSMLELGQHSEIEHQNIVSLAVNEEVDIIFLYGEETKKMTSDTISLSYFEEKSQLKEVLLAECKEGDVVLVKGSRSLRMEEIVEHLHHALS
ncbi:hypothetical protein DID78_06545 [Candidatus Marinamargulisbacteria bacterium SCGC AG-343-D04]|nr:hypothetical protein DID78_06545 [Candidatus Marinamargulisbacteria bacterium SCGC AG-343-D04]